MCGNMLECAVTAGVLVQDAKCGCVAALGQRRIWCGVLSAEAVGIYSVTPV